MHISIPKGRNGDIGKIGPKTKILQYEPNPVAQCNDGSFSFKGLGSSLPLQLYCLQQLSGQLHFLYAVFC